MTEAPPAGRHGRQRLLFPLMAWGEGRTCSGFGDVDALERVRELNAMDSHEYLAFLQQFTDRHPPTREIPPYHEPFTLGDGPFPPPPSEIFEIWARVLKKR